MTPRDRIALLEVQLRALSVAVVPLHEVVAALGERALLVFAGHRGRVLGVSVVGGRVGVHDVGEAGRVPALDRLLRQAGDRAVVVVPSPELACVPWGALPSARGRVVSVAPSLECWLRSEGQTLALRAT